jgi:hypothetical protein
MTSVRLIVAYAHMLFLLTINNLPILTGIYQNIISSFHLQIFVNNDVVDDRRRGTEGYGGRQME